MSKIDRPYDYVYDGNYTVSCYKDHVKALIKSQTHDVIISPVYENMFSALRHFPPSHYTLRPKGVQEDMGQDRSIHRGDAAVNGTNRYKYFRRPIIPYQPSLGGQVVYARKPAPAMEVLVERPVTPATRTLGVQTAFRESEAQTDPYSPEYTLKPGQLPPELLALATLSYGMGLPAGMVELEMIERARIKRAWEAMLPQVVDRETFEKRLKMMEEMELKEWQERESEIKRLQEARLKILTQVISKRERENEELNNERVERIWQKKLQEREAMLEKIESKRVKAIRKLTEKRSKVGNKLERRDIIADYANYGSKVYAPKARDGVFIDSLNSTLKVDLHELDDYFELVDLETKFPSKITYDNISLPKAKQIRLNPAARREIHLQEQLKLMDIKLKERKRAIKEEEKPLRFQQRNEKPPQRPPTPKIREPSPEDEEMDVAAILLQKLIRGRISQNLMYQGKERRLQLINELRTRHTIRRAIELKQGGKGAEQESSEDLDNATDPRGVGKDKQFRKSRSRGQAKDGGLDSNEDTLDAENAEFVEGEEFSILAEDLNSPEWLEKIFESSVQAEYVGRTLDFLSKELVRLREERRISAMVRLAERTRQIREANETHNREVELARRKEEDEVFRKVMRINQETVDSYLEDIVAGSVDNTAGIQAKTFVKEYAEKVATLVDDIEKREREYSGEEFDGGNIISDLVMSFLVPEVERESIRNQIKQEQRKYLVAAHRVIYSEVMHVEDKLLIASNKTIQDERAGEEQPTTSTTTTALSENTTAPTVDKKN